MRHDTRVRMFPRVAAAVLVGLLSAVSAGAGEQPVRVAVLTFDTYLVETNWQYAWDPSRLAPLATSLLTKELTKHRRFDVIERRYVEQLIREQDFGHGGRVNVDSAAQIGQLLGAEVVVVGDIEHFGVSTASGQTTIWKRLPGQIGIKRRKAKVELGARFVDASTGKILAVGEGEASVKSHGFRGLFGNQSVDLGSDFEEEASKVMREAMEALAQDLVSQAANIRPTPLLACINGRVAMVSDQKVYLSLDAGAPVRRGHYFEIRDPEKPIPDPDDPSKVLGYVEEKVGLVRVLEVQERVTVAEIVRGDGFAAKQLARISGGPDHPDLRCFEQSTAVARGTSSRPAGALANGDSAPSGNTEVAVTSGNRSDGSGGPGSADISTVGAAPRAANDSPVGDWRLDVNETTRYWIRQIAGIFAGVRGVDEVIREHEQDEDIEQWRDGLRELHLRLSFNEDGTFHLQMKDPTDRTLTTVDGSWKKEGLMIALEGTRIDEIPQENPHVQMLKPNSEGRLFAKIPPAQSQNQPAVTFAPWLGGWAFRWPSIHGAVFAREELARNR